jgi:hypothetical protein
MLVREKAKSVILIFILVFILLLLTASSPWMWRTTGMRHRLERRGSRIRPPWSVCAIQRARPYRGENSGPADDDGELDTQTRN